MDDLISVIMSTFNESIIEIQESINSILNQSYSNIEFIIVIDNPNNIDLINFIESFTDPRIRVIKNDENIGLVRSLNKAIVCSKGKYIARMDADDISELDRLKCQKEMLDKKNLDLIGGSINIINEMGVSISELHFPSSQSLLKIFLKWGNCIPHPTWLVRKEVYTSLNGYQNIPRCEDYDFICRTLQKKFKIGNIKKVILKYRIRSDSISNSNKGEQYVLRRFLSKNRKKMISEKIIDEYIDSELFKNEVAEYNEFQKLKAVVKEHPRLKSIIKLSLNRNTYFLGCEKFFLKLRNIL